MAGPSAGGAYYEPASGWVNAPLSFTFSSAEIAPRLAGGALGVMRRSDNNELFWTSWTKAAGFTMPQQVNTFGFGVDGPATAPVGIASVMTFLGTDNKHYFAQNDNGAMFGGFAPIPAGMVQIQAFGPSATSLASDGIGVYAVYAGDNAQLYYSYKSSAGGAWGPSTQAATSMVVNTIRPFAFVDSAMDLRIFYVRQGDNRVCMVKLITPQNAWSAEETIATATSGKQLGAVETSNGDIVVTYHGLINEGIYFVRGKDGAFTNISTVEVPAGTSSTPVVVKGLSGADAEILYATGNKLRHARIMGNMATPVDVPGLTGVTHVAATLVP